MHILQKHILDALRSSPELHYAEMQPKEIESSHFKYHLNQVIKDGLVEQKSRGVYGLTPKGRSNVDQLSRGKVNPDTTPKVITYSLLEDEQHYFLQRKDKEPYLGLCNLIGGKVHTGESTADAAEREVFEKTGITLTSRDLRAVAAIRISQNNLLLSHAIAYIYLSSITAAEAATHDLIAVRKTQLNGYSDLAPDTTALIAAVRQPGSIQAIELDLIWNK